ncbi:hypothetical protein QAD02_007029 [Eretmocerus hayati]|uniref:Uncharacterized protein n=1 Tax=Eretmocerus hayati TaxID=131215 RepID=A0ACC2N4W4_9HYME|nr:hypothetical protein QAD02_007029 [Eretmocerus hayati]
MENIISNRKYMLNLSDLVSEKFHSTTGKWNQLLDQLTTTAFCLLTNLVKETEAANDGMRNCPCTATKEYIPLCASNGVTYLNPSLFRCARRCLGRGLWIVYRGPCR